MSNSHHRKRRGKGRLRLILLLILLAAILYALLRCFVLRPPEQKEDPPRAGGFLRCRADRANGGHG